MKSLIQQFEHLPTILVVQALAIIFTLAILRLVSKPKQQLIWVTVINLGLLQGLLLLYTCLDYYTTQTLQICYFSSGQGTLIEFLRPIETRGVNFGLDTLALTFIVLTFYLVVYALILGANTRVFGNLVFFILLLEFIQLMLSITFYTTNLFIFYLGFEGLTLPTFFLIFLFGAEKMKIRAAKLFLVYSFVSSVFLSLALSLLYIQFNSVTLNQLKIRFSDLTPLNSPTALLTQERYVLIFLLLFLAFGVKVPIVPFHMWLPEAHAEASTAGSVILAGLILKLGGYGIIRYLLPLYGAFTLLNPYIQTTCLISLLLVSYSCFRVTNLKQIIAYTSIFHMNVSLLSLFSEQAWTVAGGILSFCSHSLTSSALFVCVGFLYNRFGTYEIQYISGLSQTMPLFSTIFLLFSLASMGLPFTLGFISEFIMITGLVTVSLPVVVSLAGFLSLHSVFLLWVLHRLVYSDVAVYPNVWTLGRVSHITDLTFEESTLVTALLIILIWFGFAPNILSYFLLWSL